MSEARDIVVRLWGNTGKYPGFENMNTEAAQTIESLRTTVAGLEKERDGLREALAKLQERGCKYETADRPSPEDCECAACVARAALAAGQGGAEAGKTQGKGE